MYTADLMEIDCSIENSSTLYDGNQKVPPYVELGRELLDKSKQDNVQDVLELLKRGAPKGATDWVGTSPLHWSVIYNHIDVTETLLIGGVGSDSRNKVNRTPLHVAAQYGHDKIVQVLLHYGAQPNTKDLLKMTPLHWAAQGGSLECAQLLLDYGADTHPISIFDKSPSMIARDANHYDVYNLIEETSAIDHSVRAATARILKQKSAALVKQKVLDNPVALGNNFQAIIVKSTPKKQKLGVVSDKNELNQEQKTEFIQKDPLQINYNDVLTSSNLLKPNEVVFECDDGTITTLPAIINGQPGGLTRVNSSGIKAKSIRVIPDTKFEEIQENNLKLTGGNSQKIITIKADQLINMTKERKVIITDSKTISNARFFEGKLYTYNQKEELAQKVNNKLQESKKKAESLIKQLKKVNEEIDGYNKLLGSLHKTWPVH